MLFDYRFVFGVEVSCPQLPPPCPLSRGYYDLELSFDLFSNPYDVDFYGNRCDDDNTACDIVFSVCVSRLNNRYLYIRTVVAYCTFNKSIT